MKNDYRYLVMSPLGTILVKSKSMKEVREFIFGQTEDLKRQGAFKLLCGRELNINDYTIIDIKSIPAIKDITIS